MTDPAIQAELQRGHSLHWMGVTSSSPASCQHGGASPAQGSISPCPSTSMHGGSIAGGSPCRSPHPPSPSQHHPQTIPLISPTPSPPVPPTTPPSIPSTFLCISSSYMYMLKKKIVLEKLVFFVLIKEYLFKQKHFFHMCRL